MSGLELALASLCDHLRNDLDRVCLARFLVDQDDLSRAGDTLVLLEYVTQVVDVAVQHLEVDAVFGSVDSERADRETGNGRNVAGFTTLGFDDEDTAARCGCGLTAGVGVLDESVQTCV